MHTEGSLIVGKPDIGTFTSFLISSPDSCLFDKANSEVTVGNFDESNKNKNGDMLFKGQIINGTVRNDNFNGNSIFHLHDENEEKEYRDQGVDTTLTAQRDSVDNRKPSDYTLDPVILQTEGNSKGRVVASPQQNAQWAGGTISFVKQLRIYANREEPPNVDDSYRADNRWGPKPKYRYNENEYEITANGNKIGEKIPDTVTDLIKDNPSAGANEGDVGVDGYWERRARRQGLRLIVGQRLELGNAFGWNFGATGTNLTAEPLRPWAGCSTSNNCNQARQRRSLYDNLAAVQATAVYHASSGDLDKPLACLATTVHPGTDYTLERSATFENLRYDLEPTSSTAPPIYSDFFRGRGTNGWEYDAPNIANISNAGSPLRKAMRNLANYAGDRYGGAPSFLPMTNDKVVHPFPSMAMWGDFSILRRVLDNLESGQAYNNLSPADKTTLHTAACTLGMLAHNIDYLIKYNPSQNALTELNQLIGVLTLGTTNPLQTKPLPTSSSGSTLPNNTRPEDVIAALEAWRDNANLATVPNEFDRLNRAVYMAQMLATREQIYADRRYGFLTGNRPVGGSQCQAWSSAGAPLPNLQRLCSDLTYYPILYSIFPESPGAPTPADHPEIAGQTRDQEDTGSAFNYIKQIMNPGAAVYKGVTALEIEQIALAPRAINSWVLPKIETPNAARTSPNSNRAVRIRVCSTPCLDISFKSASATTPDTNGRPDNLVTVPFKDSALMNGRELMNVRVLDMDLDLLRKNGSGLNSDTWLPKSGIVYAFREDAIGENGIVRPQTSNWASCNNNTQLQTVNCRMNTGTVNAFNSKDPPLNSANLITPKAVDYYADPDRRPNGFRLRNGIELSRANDQGRGLSLVSDNPIYIQGDFNLHRNNGGNRLEEFTTLLLDNYSNFYERKNPTNTDFAIPATDLWRPAEILADAVTILSNNFCDGSIQDGFLTAGGGSGATVPTSANPARYGCQGQASTSLVTSYLNYGRPSSALPTGVVLTNGNGWLRANRLETQFYQPNETGRSPIRINRAANPLQAAGSNAAYSQGYYKVSDNKPLNTAAATRVNATIVSGIVPSRPNQSYGGLHNFPRFLENWDTQALNIAGSFVQLNFSNYATAPFDQDAFEVGVNPGAAEELKYYLAPNRYWGYDVGLQYAAAGPLASRFQKVERVRSEFYNEPPANDPYIYNLCRVAASRPEPTGRGRTAANSCTPPA